MARHTAGQMASKTRMLLGAIRHGGEDAESIDARYGDRWDRISDKAAAKAQRLADAHRGKVEGLRTAVAAAEVDLRNARGSGKGDARRKVRDLKQQLDRAKTMARRDGVQV